MNLIKATICKLIAGLALLGGTTSLQAAVVTLDFNAAIACTGGTCINGSVISNSYGDNASLNFSWTGASSNGGAANATANWWDAQYGSLQGVAYGGGNGSSGVLRVIIEGLGGATLNSIGFDYAGWPNTDREVFVAVRSLDLSTVLASIAVTAPGIGFSNASACCGAFSAFVLDFGPDGFNAGIDNLTINYTPGNQIPEPASLALMLLALGTLGLMRQKSSRT
jgi:hypothetical protein